MSEVPVIVEVRVDHIQTADLTDQARRFSPIGKRAIAVVVKEPHLRGQPEVRAHDVQKPISIEVRHDASS